MPTPRSGRMMAVAHPAALLALALGVIALLRIGLGASSPWGDDEARALAAMKVLDWPEQTRPAERLAALTGMVPTIAGWAALTAAALMRGRRQIAAAVTMIVLGSGVSVVVLKVLLASNRVYAALGDNQVTSQSYPSGHAAGAMALALAVVVSAGPRFRMPVAIAAGSFVALQALTMLSRQWHLPSDVVAGHAVAVAWAAAAWILVMRPRWAAATWDAWHRTVAVTWASALAAMAVLAVVLAFALTDAEAIANYLRAEPTAAAVALGIVALSALMVSAVSALSHRPAHVPVAQVLATNASSSRG